MTEAPAKPHLSADVEYRDVPGFPGYRVGNDGSVWTCRKFRWGFGDRWRPMALTENKKRKGYLSVTIYGPGRSAKTWQVGALVLTVFVGPKPSDMECCHWDRDVKNNRLDNLRWGTHEDNQSDRERHGTILRGEMHPQAKLNAQSVREIRRAYAAGNVRQRDLADRFGVHVMTVNSILAGKTWRNIDG